MSEPAAMDDQRFMSLALALGRRGLGNTWPNPAVGAVVVRHGGGEPVIVGRGWTQPGGRPHAETEALRRAGPAARGATLYATLEPCSHHGQTPPCTEAIIAAGIARVVSAMEDPNVRVAGRGHALLRAAGLTVDIGVGAKEARRAHAGHIRRTSDHRPHVTLKLAVSSDAKAGLAGPKPVRITGDAARARGHLMRAMNDAILVGIGTVLADDPQLTCRLPGMAARSPVRVVLDSQLRLPIASALVHSARETPLWIAAGPAAADAAEKALSAQGAVILRVPAAAGRLDVVALLNLLADRGITSLMVEGGPMVAAAFVTADMVDEAAIMRGPQPIGADGIEALHGLPLSALTKSCKLHASSTEMLGPDTIESFERPCLPVLSPTSAK
jgi:diaminohydroxyphosphoribosylaminopyrimidine deaminase/5-amino-6-(5-phosphoribosylamino)uracil reductase